MNRMLFAQAYHLAYHVIRFWCFQEFSYIPDSDVAAWKISVNCKLIHIYHKNAFRQNTHTNTQIPTHTHTHTHIHTESRTVTQKGRHIPRHAFAWSRLFKYIYGCPPWSVSYSPDHCTELLLVILVVLSQHWFHEGILPGRKWIITEHIIMTILQRPS